VVPRRRERPPNGSFRHPCHRPCRAGSLLHSRMQYWIRISNILRTNNKLVCAQLDVELTNVEMNSRVKECKCPGGFSVHSLPTPTLAFRNTKLSRRKPLHNRPIPSAFSAGFQASTALRVLLPSAHGVWPPRRLQRSTGHVSLRTST
jgi:hypothetical protein